MYAASFFKNVSVISITFAYLNCVSMLNGTTREHTKENRQLRRQSSSESDDSEKKRLKTVC